MLAYHPEGYLGPARAGRQVVQLDSKKESSHFENSPFYIFNISARQYIPRSREV